MKKQLRNTGIKVIGDVSWGTHLCQFYQTKKDLLDILVPYFRTGLEDNEYCMWVTSEPLNQKEAFEAMETGLANFDHYLKKGQIEIIHYTEWYLKGGKFDSQRVLNGWLEKLDQALARGYDGLRLTGDTFWLEKEYQEKFVDYEKEISDVIGKNQIIAFCTFPLDKCGPNEIIDVVENHQFAIVRRKGKWEIIGGEKALREREERFRAVANYTYDWENWIGTDGKPLWVNPAVQRITGYSVDECLAMPDFPLPLIDEDDREMVAQKIRGAIQGTSENDFEFQVRHKAGHPVWVAASWQPIYDSRGASLGHRSSLRDINERKRAEEELKKYKTIVSSTPDGIALLDECYRYRIVNDAYERFAGVKREQLIGLTVAEYLGEDVFQQHVKPNFDRCLQGETITYQDWFDYPGLGRRCVTVTYFPYRDMYNRIVGVVANTIDITERKQAEEELLLHRNHLEELVKQRTEELVLLNHLVYGSLESGDVGVFWNDFREEDTYYSLDNAQKMLGRTPAKDRSYRISKWLQLLIDTKTAFPEYADVIDKALEQFSGAISNKYKNYRATYPILMPDGSVKWFDTRAEVPLRDEQGKALLMTGTFIDITQRKCAEEALRESEERFRVIASSTPDQLLVQDRELRYSFVMNPPLDLTEKDMIGKTDYDFLSKENADKLTKIKKQVIETGKPVHLETPLFSMKGKEQFFDGSYVPKFNAEGRIDGLIGYFRNVTERKQAEEVLRRYEMLSGHSRDIILFMRRDNGRILEANAAATNTYGYSRDELLTLTIQDLRAPDTQALTSDQMAEADARGILFETVHRRKDGSTFPVEVSSRGATTGATRTLISLVRNITRRKEAEQALRQSEKRYRSYIEVTEQLGWTTNADGEVVEDIPSWKKVTGQSEEEVKGWGWLKALHPDDLEHTAGVWRNALTTKKNYEAEYRIRRYDGVYRHFLDRGVPVFKDDGSIQEWVGTCIDITERKKAEEVLRQSEERFRFLVQQVKDYSIVYLNTEGRIVSWNEGAERIHGYRAEEAAGKHFSIFYPKEAIERGDPRRMLEITRVEGQFKEEGWRVRKDGSRFWADVVLTALHDEIGALKGFTMMTRDITERKNIEEAINYRLAMEELVVTISNRFVSIPPEEIDKEINRALELVKDFTGADRSYLCLLSNGGVTITDFYESCSSGASSRAGELQGLSLESFPWMFDKLKRGEEICAFDITDLPSEATAEREFWRKSSVQATAAIPITFGQSLLGYFAINSDQKGKKWASEDIKLLRLVREIFASALQRKRAEEDRKKLEAEILEGQRREAEVRQRENEKWIGLGQMASGIAHDIRNPINFVSLALDHLSGKDLKRPEEECEIQNLFNGAHSELVRVSEMVQGLLDYGRSQTLHLEIQNASEILVESRKEIIRRHPAEKLFISLEGIDDLFPILTDRDLLFRALENLLENALEAGGPGGSVRAGVGYQTMDKSNILLWVEDAGPGIAEENLGKIFSPYFTTKKSGVGLGLTLTRTWVHEMGGKIQVHNIPGGGARFEVSFPVANTDADERRGIEDKSTIF